MLTMVVHFLCVFYMFFHVEYIFIVVFFLVLSIHCSNKNVHVIIITCKRCLIFISNLPIYNLLNLNHVFSNIYIFLTYYFIVIEISFSCFLRSDNVEWSDFKLTVFDMCLLYNSWIKYFLFNFIRFFWSLWPNYYNKIQLS